MQLRGKEKPFLQEGFLVALHVTQHGQALLDTLLMSPVTRVAAAAVEK